MTSELKTFDKYDTAFAISRSHCTDKKPAAHSVGPSGMNLDEKNLLGDSGEEGGNGKNIKESGSSVKFDPIRLQAVKGNNLPGEDWSIAMSYERRVKSER